MDIKLYGDGINDDTYAIQALLDERGTVSLSGGMYLISRPLIIHDNTHLVLSPDAVMKLADNANCAIIENDLLSERGTNFNITISGGIWDGNNENQVRRSRESRFALTEYEEDYYYGIFMRFVGVKKFTIRDLIVKNPESYAMLISNADDFTVENISFDYNMLRTNMDGIHVQGVARNGSIRNIRGATNDDLVALNCDDTYACEITRGIIENMTIENLYSDNGYTGVRLLSCGSVMRNIQIRNVFGTYRFYGVSFTHHNIHPGEPVWFDNISVDGVFASKPPQHIYGQLKNDGTYTSDYGVDSLPIIWFANGVHCGNVTLRNIHRIEEAITKAPTVQIDENVFIDRLKIDDLTQVFVNCDEVYPVMNNGNVEMLLFDIG